MKFNGTNEKENEEEDGDECDHRCWWVEMTMMLMLNRVRVVPKLKQSLTTTERVGE